MPKIIKEGVIYSDGGQIVDTALDSTSTNPVENRVITNEINTINQQIAELERSGGMPNLDTKNPVHVFYTSIPSGEPATQTYGLTFTATEDCYLCGSIAAAASSSNARVMVNGVGIASALGNNYTGGAEYIPPFKLENGDVVEVLKGEYDLHIFKAKEN